MDGTVIAAFPANLSKTVGTLDSLFELSSHLSSNEPFSIFCDGESLVIPCRVYSSAPPEATFQKLSSLDQTIMACWFTRHNDGHIRERFLRSIPTYDSSWIIGYVMALCGEAIIEILDYIWQNRSQFNQVTLGHWLRDNQPFYTQTCSRIVSHWNCYDHRSCPNFENHIGSRLIAFFDGCLIRDKESGGI